MSPTNRRPLDPQLDLMVEREVRASAQTAWAAWTQPEHLRRWYAPHPGVVADCEIDLRPGGIFRFVLRVRDGVENPVVCCYLVVEPFTRLVWTNATSLPSPASSMAADKPLMPPPTTRMLANVDPSLPSLGCPARKS